MSYRESAELVKVSDVASRITKGTTPTTLGYEFTAVGVNFVKVESIAEDGQIIPDKLAHISYATHEALKRSQLQENDVLYSIAGAIGRVAVFHKRYLPANTNQAVALIRCNVARVEPRYLAYALRSRDIQLQAKGKIVQSVQANFSLGELGNIEFELPSIDKQRQVVSQIGALDDKIDLNRRLNGTLEEITRALFKCWFVDFEPVCIKAEGKDPSAPVSQGGLGLDPAIAALFPNSFEDSALGEIPKGWRVGVLGDVAEEVRQQVSPASLDPATPYIGLEHMPRRTIQLDEWGRAGDVTSGKSRFQRGQILFGKLRPYFHKVGIAPVDGVCSTDIIVVSPVSKAWLGFALGHLTSDELVDFANRGSTGTKMPRTSWRTMASYGLVVPDEKLAIAFNSIVAAQVELVIAAVHQSRALSEARDALLPKLMSGDLRVNDEEV